MRRTYSSALQQTAITTFARTARWKSAAVRTRLYPVWPGNYHNLNTPFVRGRSVKSVRALPRNDVSPRRTNGQVCRKPEAFGPRRAPGSMDRQIRTVTFDCIIPSLPGLFMPLRKSRGNWGPEDFLADGSRELVVREHTATRLSSTSILDVPRGH